MESHTTAFPDRFPALLMSYPGQGGLLITVTCPLCHVVRDLAELLPSMSLPQRWCQHSAMKAEIGCSPPEISLGHMKYQPRIHPRRKAQRLQHHLERKVKGSGGVPPKWKLHQ